jgi:hypothetical protein
VRRYAKTRDEVKKRSGQIPLFGLWKTYHLDAAADFVEELRGVAEEAAGHPVLLSANACLGSAVHHHVVTRLTHVVCEVWFDADKGTDSLDGALRSFEAARGLERPLACTASGHDWAHVKAHGTHELARFWIALTYAHGQRFMVPHPSRQWCFNETLGTHWLAAPVEEYAPLYRFMRESAVWLDGFEATLDVSPKVPSGVIATARKNGAKLVVHLVQRDYDAETDRMREAKDIRIRLPASAVAGAKTATLRSFGAEPVSVPVRIEDDQAIVVVPELRLWTLVCFER